jgi:hypothetical protein
MQTNYSGLAAAHELDVLLSHDDFEPAVEVDTVALDSAIDAVDEAARLLEALISVRDALKQGKDARTVAGFSLDVHLLMDSLGGLTADLGGHDVKPGVVL